MSTQAGFGDILAEIGRGQGDYKELAAHIVTTSPDVTVSTNLGPWVNRRGIFDRHTRNDVFRDAKLASRAALGHVAARASMSNSASPSRTCSCCWAPRGSRTR